MAVLGAAFLAHVPQNVKKARKVRAKKNDEKKGLVDPKAAAEGGEGGILLAHDVDDDEPKGEERGDGEAVDEQLSDLARVVVEIVSVEDGLRLRWESVTL